MGNKYYHIFDRLSAPIRHESVFFVFFFLLMGKSALNGLFKTVLGWQESDGIWINIGEAFLIAYLFTYIINSFSRRWVKVTGYALFFALFFFREFIRTVFVIDISPNVLTLMLETNSSESAEFFRYYVWSAATLKPLLLTVMLALLAWVFEKWSGKMNTVFMRFVPHLRYLYGATRQTLSVLTALGLLWGLLASVSYIRMLRCSDLDELSQWDYEEATYAGPFTKLASSFYALHLASEEMEEFVRHTQEMAAKQQSACNDSLNLIVVIGESYIKNHSSLYGYPLKTCPWQEAARDSGNLIVFNQARTTSNMTSEAMKDILSTNSSQKGEKWNEGIFFPSVLRQTGWNVFLWDNQRSQYSSMMLSFSLNTFLYHPTIRAISYTDYNKNSFEYDENLVKDFEKTPHQEGTRNLVLFHLKGQHFDAAERFPHKQQFLSRRSQQQQLDDRLQKTRGCRLRQCHIIQRLCTLAYCCTLRTSIDCHFIFSRPW